MRLNAFLYWDRMVCLWKLTHAILHKRRACFCAQTTEIKVASRTRPILLRVVLTLIKLKIKIFHSRFLFPRSKKKSYLFFFLLIIENKIREGWKGVCTTMGKLFLALFIFDALSGNICSWKTWRVINAYKTTCIYKQWRPRSGPWLGSPFR